MYRHPELQSKWDKPLKTIDSITTAEGVQKYIKNKQRNQENKRYRFVSGTSVKDCDTALWGG